MSTLWLREITTSTNGIGTGIPFALKALAMFLRYCCGGTPNSDDHTNDGVGDSLTRSGSGPNWTVTLVDAGAYFEPSIVGGSITITGSNNNNDGMFAITSRPNTTTLVWTNAASLGNGGSTFTWLADATSWYAAQKTGTNGEINTGNNKRFRDTVAGSFVPVDTGKWLLICSTNPRNCGLFKVTYVDANNVDIDYRSGTTEYPVNETGLSWHLLGDDWGVPTQRGNYFRIDMPGGWGLEAIPIYGPAIDHMRWTINIAPDSSDWTRLIGPIYTGALTSTTNWLYAAFDTSGDMLSVMLHQATNSRHNGFMVSKIVPTDTYATIEKMALLGNTGPLAADFDNGNFERTYSSKRVGHAYCYDNLVSAQRDCYMLEPSYAGYASGLSRWTARERSRRRSGATAGGGTGDSIAMAGSTATLTDAGAAFVVSDIGKKIRVSGCTNAANNGWFTILSRPSATQITFLNASGVNETSSFVWSMDREDLLNGTLLVTDENNYSGRYELIGRLKGFYSVRGGTTSGWNIRKAFDQDGYLDKYHFNDGIAFDWPNVTQQH